MKQRVSSVALFAILICGCSTEKKASNQSAQATNAIRDEQKTAQNSESVGLGEYIGFRTCGIKLRRPDGFQETVNFDGFGQTNTRATIMLVNIPGSFSKIAEGFTESELKKRGWTMLSKQNINIDGLPGILVHFEQPTADKVNLKWGLAFGDDYKTTMVTATLPKDHEQELSARLKSAVMSTRLDSTVRPN